MNIILSFIGPLPVYVIYCVYQIRLYTDMPIYLIFNDHTSKYLDELERMGVTPIRSNTLDLLTETEILDSARDNFVVVDELNERKDLFYRSFERFYLLKALVQLYQLEEILFLEIDNLIYEDPDRWLKIFQSLDVKTAFMIDNFERVSTGVAYFKEEEMIKRLTDHFDNYLTDGKKRFLNEMEAVHGFYLNNREHCLILPSLESDGVIPAMSENFRHFGTLFDPSSYGIYLLGYDTFHTGGRIILYQTNKFGCLKPTKAVRWIYEDGKKRPYLLSGDTKILISNLHVHSKNLADGLSTPYG